MYIIWNKLIKIAGETLISTFLSTLWIWRTSSRLATGLQYILHPYLTLSNHSSAFILLFAIGFPPLEWFQPNAYIWLWTPWVHVAANVSESEVSFLFAVSALMGLLPPFAYHLTLNLNSVEFYKIRCIRFESQECALCQMKERCSLHSLCIYFCAAKKRQPLSLSSVTGRSGPRYLRTRSKCFCPSQRVRPPARHRYTTHFNFPPNIFLHGANLSYTPLLY